MSFVPQVFRWTVPVAAASNQYQTSGWPATPALASPSFVAPTRVPWVVPTISGIAFPRVVGRTGCRARRAGRVAVLTGRAADVAVRVADLGGSHHPVAAHRPGRRFEEEGEGAVRRLVVPGHTDQEGLAGRHLEREGRVEPLPLVLSRALATCEVVVCSQLIGRVARAPGVDGEDLIRPASTPPVSFVPQVFRRTVPGTAASNEYQMSGWPAVPSLELPSFVTSARVPWVVPAVSEIAFCHASLGGPVAVHAEHVASQF